MQSWYNRIRKLVFHVDRTENFDVCVETREALCMLLFLNSCVLSLSAVLWTSLDLCGKFTSQSMLFLSCGSIFGVLLISVSVGENNGGCRGLDLFWGVS